MPIPPSGPESFLFSVVTSGQPSSLDYPTMVKVTAMKGEDKLRWSVMDAAPTPAGSRGARLRLAGPPRSICKMAEQSC